MIPARLNWLVVPALLLHLQNAARAAETARPTAQLKLERPGSLEQCPDEATLRSLTRTQLGYEPFVDQAARSVTVTFTQSASGLMANVEIRDAGRTHKRSLRSADLSCQELAHATAFALALAIDPFHSGQASPKPPELSCPPCNPSAPGAAIVPTKLQGRAGVAPLLTFGSTPGKVGFGLVLHADLRWKIFELGLEGRIDPQVSRTHSAAGDVGASLYLVSLVPCVHVRAVFACATFGIGALRGIGLASASEQTTVYANGGWRVGFEWQLRHVSLRAYGEVAATLTRTTLAYDVGPIWTSPPVSGSLGLSLLYRFL